MLHFSQESGRARRQSSFRICPIVIMALLFARGNASLVKEVVVAGKTIAKDGACMGVDLPAIEQELRAMYRVNVGKLGSFQRMWPSLSERVSGWFEQQLTCE